VSADRGSSRTTPIKHSFASASGALSLRDQFGRDTERTSRGIVTQGGRFGGYGFYVLKGKPVFLSTCIDTDLAEGDRPTGTVGTAVLRTRRLAGASFRSVGNPSKNKKSQ